MSDTNGSKVWQVGGICLAVGLFVGYLAAPQPGPPANPEERVLNADLWMQTAAEYRACCLQTYQLAEAQLPHRLKERKKKDLPPAVVMDLDETVLDNSPYETWLYHYARTFDDPSWERWEQSHASEVRLVPGAARFIREAERQGVTVIYISNRTEKYRDGTVEALRHLKLDTNEIDRRLFLKEGVSSDKSDRRREVEKRFDVVMYFGDNLRDFSEEFKARPFKAHDVADRKAAIRKRLDKVDGHAAKWGAKWVILPNPVYGEWPKLAKDRPLEVMNPTTMKPPQ